jgi:hypothetical protein
MQTGDPVASNWKMIGHLLPLLAELNSFEEPPSVAMAADTICTTLAAPEASLCLPAVHPSEATDLLKAG